MSEVTATGMHILYPQVCREGILYPHKHTFRVRASYWRGQTLYKSNYTGFLRTLGNGQVELEAYVLRYVVNKVIIIPSGFKDIILFIMLYKCDLVNAKKLKIETQDSIVIVHGDYYNDRFYPHSDELMKKGINEKAFFDYIKNNPSCTNVKLAQY